MKQSSKDRARAKRLLDNYQLTIEQYDAMLAFQGGVCFVCREPEPVSGRRLSVDHDHESGLIRGLLCSRCNPIIGKLENARKRYGLTKVISSKLLALRISGYLYAPPSVTALGGQHFGYSGRVGTKAHRKRLRRAKKLMLPSVRPLEGTC